jgi:hypothetical protein
MPLADCRFTEEAHDMLLLPALKRVQHFKRIACMFMLLDLAGRVHFYRLHYQVQTIRTSKMLRVKSESVSYFDMNILVWCTHLHDIAVACGIDNASIIKNALLDSIVSLFPPRRNETNTRNGKKFCR